MSTLEVLENISDKTLAVYYFTFTDENEVETGIILGGFVYDFWVETE